MDMSKVKNDALGLLEAIVILEEIVGNSASDLAQGAILSAGIKEEEYLKMCDFIDTTVTEEELNEYVKVKSLGNLVFYAKELIEATK